MKEIEFILSNISGFLKFLGSKFKLIHNSNFFFRDFQYGIMIYLNDQGMNSKYNHAEIIAREIGRTFEQKGIFKKIDNQSWTLSYPEFTLSRKEKKIT